MKKRLMILSVVILPIILLASFLLTNVFCWPGCYKSNSSLDREANNQIKRLLLNSMKDYWDMPYPANKNEIYTDEYIKEYLSDEEDEETVRNWFIIIDRKFMDTVTEKGGGAYEGYIQAIYPEDYRFYYRIEVIDGDYKITEVGIDP